LHVAGFRVRAQSLPIFFFLLHSRRAGVSDLFSTPPGRIPVSEMISFFFAPPILCSSSKTVFFLLIFHGARTRIRIFTCFPLLALPIPFYFNPLPLLGFAMFPTSFFSLSPPSAFLAAMRGSIFCLVCSLATFEQAFFYSLVFTFCLWPFQVRGSHAPVFCHSFSRNPRDPTPDSILSSRALSGKRSFQVVLFLRYLNPRPGG